ncbi:MAG: calcineurin-like phosphoesterase C-terminal domain-containing protein [Bacteroidales bacterium]|nr:calcineurin-like phosphoesterase C-terminal domain-containing protein [Bacteroidales bacterium]
MHVRKIFLLALTLVALACTGVKNPEEEPGNGNDPGSEVVPVDPDPDPDPEPDPYADLEGLVIRTAEEFRAFLASPTEEEKVHLVVDVDLQGESVSASSFSGVLDGHEHTIANPGAPLFTSNSGTIQNLTVTGAFTPETNVFAPVILENSGTVSKVVNRASVTINRDAPTTESVIIGGIVAQTSGPISDCTNEGAINFTSTSSVKGVAIGGIAGYQTAAISGCTNSGELSFKAHHPAGSSAIGSITDALVSLGGIAGYGYTGFSVTDSHNTGALSFDFTAIETITADSERHQIGGIAGSPCGTISGCSNSGNIHIGAITSGRSAYNTHCFIFNAGGIAGGDFFAPGQNVTSILDCTNSGAIDADFDASDSNNTIAGIVGWPNLEANVTNRTEGCVNTGTITVHGAGKGRFGGIQAGTGRILNCRNEGDILIESTATTSSAGGVCAFHSFNHTLSGSSNTGNIRSKVNLTAGQGGLIGSLSNQALTIGEGCSADCTLENVAERHSALGMVVGYYMGNTKKIILGTSASPISVAGNISLNGVSIPLTTANYQDWLAGTANASSANHVIYAQCSNQGSGITQVTGHVRYNDGTPASGVSVSNGFDVAVTDATGSYTLPDNDDVWYYYISLPSDATIAKNSDGCPDFYKRRLKGSSVYDFTLKRQPVESRFLLYALADPQAYHVKSDNQSMSNTDRFRTESVPAVNANISAASLPCYVVTLGDIIYNEGTRNSTGGLTTMRNHCAGINAPVFQTFGNHDYTFFSSSSPLTTDASSSTLYLKAQRAFEECFGPINFSFNRGNVHVVCMRNVIWDSNTTNSQYHGGFTDEQYAWLQADLANVPTSKTVVFCVHIPMMSCLRRSDNHAAQVVQLLKRFARAEIFSGHTHLMHNIPDMNGSGIYEHVHTAVCGMFWWCNLAVDGCPNGYSIYEFSGGDIVDSYFTGVNTRMNTRDYQMRIYRGGLKYGGQYIYFQSPHTRDKLFINVFNADSNWKVEVYENGVYAGDAQLMPEKMETHTDAKYSTVVFGEDSSQDWWAAAYPVGVLGRGFNGNNLQPYGDFQDSCYHMYKYTMKNASASVKVIATDGFGNRYECTDVIEEDCWYPDYIKFGNI